MRVLDNLERGIHMLFQKGADWVQNHKWLQRLADEADLSGEPLPGVPVVELAGDSRVLIERHKGVTEYSREKIGIHMCFGKLEVTGCNLELSCMTRDQLVISGRISGILIQRKGKG